MIDPHTEDLFPLAKGPPDLKPSPSAATLWRWALRGVRGRKLETLVIGGRRYCSRKAFDAFISQLNEAQVHPPAPTSRLRARQKSAAAKRAATTF